MQCITSNRCITTGGNNVTSLENQLGHPFLFVNFCHHKQQNNDINKLANNRKTVCVTDCSGIRDKLNAENKSIFLGVLTDLYA